MFVDCTPSISHSVLFFCLSFAEQTNGGLMKKPLGYICTHIHMYICMSKEEKQWCGKSLSHIQYTRSFVSSYTCCCACTQQCFSILRIINCSILFLIFTYNNSVYSHIFHHIDVSERMHIDARIV